MRCRSLRTMTWSRHPRRIDPIKRGNNFINRAGRMGMWAQLYRPFKWPGNHWACPAGRAVIRVLAGLAVQVKRLSPALGPARLEPATP